MKIIILILILTLTNFTYANTKVFFKLNWPEKVSGKLIYKDIYNSNNGKSYKLEKEFNFNLIKKKNNYELIFKKENVKNITFEPNIWSEELFLMGKCDFFPNLLINNKAKVIKITNYSTYKKILKKRLQKLKTEKNKILIKELLDGFKLKKFKKNTLDYYDGIFFYLVRFWLMYKFEIDKSYTYNELISINGLDSKQQLITEFSFKGTINKKQKNYYLFKINKYIVGKKNKYNKRYTIYVLQNSFLPARLNIYEYNNFNNSKKMNKQIIEFIYD